MRKRMRCGWIRDSEWAPEEQQTRGWGEIAGTRLQPTTCPGYTCALPEVQEVARAWAWNEKGGFIPRYRALGMAINDELSELIDMFAGEQAAAEAWEMDQRTKQRGH